MKKIYVYGNHSQTGGPGSFVYQFSKYAEYHITNIIDNADVILLAQNSIPEIRFNELIKYIKSSKAIFRMYSGIFKYGRKLKK